MLLLGELVLLSSVLDDVIQLSDFTLLLLNRLQGLLLLLDFAIKLYAHQVYLLQGDSVVVMLRSKGLVLLVDLLFQLGDLMRSNFELAIQLCHVVLRFEQVFGIQVLL